MRGILAVAGAHKIATVVLLSAVVAGGVTIHAVTDDRLTATVAKVVDGDTIDVRYDGGTHRVRLLNVNAPESVDPDKPVECLGPEASDWLKRRLPVGTDVRLEHDKETQDRYGRELAAVFDGDVLIDAEIARAGLGVPMAVGSNTKYLPPVQAAHAEALTMRRGLYSTSLDCSLATQVDQLEQSTTMTIQEAPASTAALSDFDGHAAALAALMVTTKTLADSMAGVPDDFPLVAYTAAQVSDLRSRVSDVRRRLDSATASNTAARQVQQHRLEAEAQQEAEEAARKAAEKAAADAAAQQAAEQTKARSGSTSSHSSGSSSAIPTTSAPTKSPSGSGSGSSGYTGCRSYAPGGKTWTPIPCPTH